MGLAALAFAACGGGGDGGGTAAGSPAAGVSATPAAALSPTATAILGPATIGPVVCEGGSIRDARRRWELALSDPPCLLARAGDGVPSTVVVSAGGRGATASLQPGGPAYRLPADFSPYTAGRCAPGASFRLEMAVTAQGEAAPGLRLVFECPPGEAQAGAGGSAVCGPPPANLETSSLARTRGPAGEYCLAWTDEYQDELGFRVEISYDGGGLVFAYLLPPGTTSMRVPDEAAPRLDESAARCLERKDSAVSVVVLRAGGERTAGSSATVVECGQ